MRILVDQSILMQEEISIGSGERNVTVILRSQDLVKGLDPLEAGSFAKPQPGNNEKEAAG
jgi:prolyl-tRNA editing enzyme YbaK/EbsC (Cys-tRNA(Pro) deacylase)